MAAMSTTNTRILIFDESQAKYKCCCGCMTVRTGTAIIATLKFFGVLMAVLELFTGPHFLPGYFSNIDTADQPTKIRTTDNSAFDSQSDTDDSQSISATTAIDNNAGLGAVRFASTAIYLLVEAVAVSCLFYAIRRERPKFVIPEMALILVCMSLELVVALLVVVGAAFGSESLVQLVINRLRAQGTEVTSGDVDQIRRFVPFVLTAFAFVLIVGAAIEFWFFRVLKAFYGYLRDKTAFRSFSGIGDAIDIHHRHGGVHFASGYQPMMEESVGDDVQKNMPPTYQEIVQQSETDGDQSKPPAYKEFVAEPEQPAPK